MLKTVVAFALLLATAACSSSYDPPLPIVHADGPTFELAPDHLDYGSLPR